MSDQTVPQPARRPAAWWVWRGDKDHFGLPARLFHWLTPLLLIGSFGLIFSVNWLPAGPDRVSIVRLHRTIGIIVLTLTLLRLLWRLADRHPAALGPRASRWLARLVHGAFYALLLCTPLLGWSYTNARGHVLYIFGQALPSLIFKDEYLSRLAISWHEWCAYILLGLICLHLVAALWHQFWLKDGAIRRIWRG